MGSTEISLTKAAMKPDKIRCLTQIPVATPILADIRYRPINPAIKLAEINSNPTQSVLEHWTYGIRLSEQSAFASTLLRNIVAAMTGISVHPKKVNRRRKKYNVARK